MHIHQICPLPTQWTLVHVTRYPTRYTHVVSQSSSPSLSFLSFTVELIPLIRFIPILSICCHTLWWTEMWWRITVNLAIFESMYSVIFIIASICFPTRWPGQPVRIASRRPHPETRWIRCSQPHSQWTYQSVEDQRRCTDDGGGDWPASSIGG